MKDLVSVVVPVYKVEKYLTECVESIVGQTYKNLEIILVDDGSPDNCPKMCDDWAKQDKRIKVIHKPNGGLMAAWVDGVKICNGKYVCFVDSDDYVKKDFVEKLYEGLINNSADVCACNYLEVSETDVNYRKFVNKNCVVQVSDNVDNLVLTFNEKLEVSTPHCRWNKIYKKDVILDSFKYLDTRVTMGEDLNLTFYVLGVSKKCAFIEDFLYCYRIINNSMSHKPKDNWFSYEKLLWKLLEINEKENMEMDRFICSMYYMPFTFTSVKYYLDNNKKQELDYILNCDITKKVLKEIKPIKFKHKIFALAMKLKSKVLLRLACK